MSIYDVALASGLEVPDDDSDEYIETPDSPDKATRPNENETVFDVSGMSCTDIGMGKC